MEFLKLDRKHEKNVQSEVTQDFSWCPWIAWKTGEEIGGPYTGFFKLKKIQGLT